MRINDLINTDYKEHTAQNKNKILKESTDILPGDLWNAVKDKYIDIYDLDTFIKEGTDFKYKIFYDKFVGIVKTNPHDIYLFNDEGWYLKFKDISDNFEIAVIENKENKKYTRADGVEVEEIPIQPAGYANIPVKDILEDAKKQTKKISDFFTRVDSSWNVKDQVTDLLAELYRDGYFEENVFLENNNLSKGAQAAQIVAKALKGECGPSGGRGPYLHGNRVGLYSQYPTEVFRFNNDGSIVFENLAELIYQYPWYADEVFGIDSHNDEEVEEVIANFQFYKNIDELINSGSGWFIYFKDEHEDAYLELKELFNSEESVYVENLTETFHKIDKEHEDWLDNQIEANDFKIVSKRVYGWGEDKTDVHYQIISNKGNKSKEDFELAYDWLDALLEKLEAMSGCPCTLNMALQVDGYISAGFDVRGYFYDPSVYIESRDN